MKKTNPKRLRVTVEVTTITRQEYIIAPDKLEGYKNYPGDPGLLNLTVDKEGLYHYRDTTLKHQAKFVSAVPTRLKKFKED